MPGGVTAGQADGWPPAGKAISLSTVQGRQGGRRAGVAVAAPVTVLPQTTS